MKCEKCGKHKATIAFTKIVNNKKTVNHLCRECSDAQGFGTASASSFGVENLVSKIANEYEDEKNSVACLNCGLKYYEFKETGRLGCGDCYSAFSHRLDDLLRKIHGADNHAGKIPKKIEPSIKINKKFDTLKKELKLAVLAEEFENAAIIRDKIKKMEQKNG